MNTLRNQFSITLKEFSTKPQVFNTLSIEYIKKPVFYHTQEFSTKSQVFNIDSSQNQDSFLYILNKNVVQKQAVTFITHSNHLTCLFFINWYFKCSGGQEKSTCNLCKFSVYKKKNRTRLSRI